MPTNVHSSTLHAQLRQLRHDLSCSASLDYISPHCRVVNLGLPWCGRQLRWQLVFGPVGSSSSSSPPDVVFDDETFRPLCSTAASSSSTSAQPGAATAFSAAAAALAGAAPPVAGRTGSIGGGSGGSGSAGGGGGCSPEALRAMLLGWPATAELQLARPEALTRLVSSLLQAYRLHQRKRLEAAAARLPRLQFELSTLDTGAGDSGGGVQMELQQQTAQTTAAAAPSTSSGSGLGTAAGAAAAAAAIFSVPLPGVELTQLLQLAAQLGARLPPGLLPPPPAAAAAAAAPGSADAAGEAAASGGGEGPGVGQEDDSVLEPLLQGEEQAAGQEAADRGGGREGGGEQLGEGLQVNRGPASPGAVAGAAAAAAAARAATSAAAGGAGGGGVTAGGAAGKGQGAMAAAAAAALPPLVLQARFRLPSGAGDISDPELLLLVPPVLVDLQAQSNSPLPPGVLSAGALGTGGGGGAPASSSSPYSTSPGAGSAALRLPNSSGGGGAAGGGGGAAGGGGGGGPKIGVSLLPPFLLPLWSAHMCLAEYIPLAADRLKLQIDAHCLLLSTRIQLLALLGDMLGGPPLELNAAAGTALYGTGWEGAAVLLALELGPRFPADKPALTLQSVRMLGAPDSSRTYRDYPWSPRWGAREMAARIHNWIQEELPNFLKTRLPAPPPPS